ncbi:MAG: hypothetical protein MZV70_69170 [Desulfobacterales bacterium]|nr:hypothetical protein [Desulfobacterales bacterium]
MPTSKPPRAPRSLLAAVLLKMGAYGFIRFAFPLSGRRRPICPGSGRPGDHRHHLRRL